MARPRYDEGVAGWIRRSWRALIAELMSTAILLWLGLATVVPSEFILSHPALAFGFVVVANICAFGDASGAHMNPAVTLAAVLYGVMDPILAVGYVIAQLLGAVIGFAGLMATSPSHLVMTKVGVTLPAAGISPLAATVIEAVITATLVLSVCGVWASHNPALPDNTVAIKIGLIVAGLVYAAGPLTGAGFNPARSFAPALLQGNWQDHWVYWVGPLIGAALAALLHRYVITARKTSASETHPAENPLNDKP